MKLHILSDLHIGYSGLEPPRSDADVVILAGDVARPREAVTWAAQYDKPVLYVPGNHEFYGSSLAAATAEIERQSSGTSVRLLDRTELVIGGVRFLGTTLWTDFMLFGAGEPRAVAMTEAQKWMRDFSRIRVDEPEGRAFSPDDAAALFARDARWLEARLAANHDGPTVVITHHAPSPRSIHPRFAGSPVNAAFVSNLEHLMGADRVGLWIHGHTHDSFDYLVNGTRVVCNPRGYAKEGVNENARFDAHLVIETDPAKVLAAG
jgi:predicted phosphodiesterase